MCARVFARVHARVLACMCTFLCVLYVRREVRGVCGGGGGEGEHESLEERGDGKRKTEARGERREGDRPLTRMGAAAQREGATNCRNEALARCGRLEVGNLCKRVVWYARQIGQ